ncbi:uncharacterized protein TNCV_2653261 [Trichonephila clavipes]|nr:uncharacterized protein TNCV_2653261 [Trichonephila clavipes]
MRQHLINDEFRGPRFDHVPDGWHEQHQQEQEGLSLSPFAFKTHTGFYDFQKNEWKILERWRAVGRIEAGQSSTDVALFFGVHHSVISRLWKTIPKPHRQLSEGYKPRGRSIYCYCSQAD